MSLNRRSNHLLRDMVMKMRSVFILLLIVAYAGPYLSQGYVYTSRYGAVLNAWGTFACAMSNAKILLVCFVGYILLISDVPYFSAANIYEVVRSKRWTIMPVRVIALLKVTLLYFAVLFVLFCILGGCTDFNPNVWDRIHYSYAHGQYIEDLYMDVPGNVIANYMILQRCSVFRYLNTLFVRTAVSGFAVMAVGTLLFLGLIPVCFPHAVLSYELEEIGGLIMPFLETVAQAENWFAYFGFYTLLIGISGVFWGVLALTVSAWVDNTYAIYIFPILFLFAMDYVAPHLHLYSLSGQMFAMYYYETWQQALLYPLVTFGSMSVLCYLAFIYRGRRNCRES